MKKKYIRTGKLKCFQWKYIKEHNWIFHRINKSIYLPQSLYQNSGSFLFLRARTNVLSTNKTQRASFLISQAHPHILKLICWNNFFIKKKKITAFQTLYWSNICVFLCLFILKTSFKGFFSPPSPLSKKSVGTYATFRLTILEISFRIALYLYQKSSSSTCSTYLK